MDPIQKYARNLEPGIRQCLLTQSAAATPSRILPPHPQVWIHADQPSGVSRGRHTTARPLVRAKLLLPSTAYIIQTSIPSASPILAAFGYLYRLLVRSSAYTIYHHRTRACVINYWRQCADVLIVSLPTTPSERTRKIRPEQPEHATRSQWYCNKMPNCL
jgi:hypothetical protein